MKMDEIKKEMIRLLDEAYKKGYEEGKKPTEDHVIRRGDIVQSGSVTYIVTNADTLIEGIDNKGHVLSRGISLCKWTGKSSFSVDDFLDGSWWE